MTTKEFERKVVEFVSVDGQTRCLPVDTEMNKWHVRFPRVLRDLYPIGSRFVTERIIEGKNQYVQIGRIFSLEGKIVYSDAASEIGKTDKEKCGIPDFGKAGAGSSVGEFSDEYMLPRLGEDLASFAARIGMKPEEAEELFFGL